MTEIMEAYSRQTVPAHECPKCARQTVPGRLTVLLGNDVMVVNQSDAELQEPFRLLPTTGVSNQLIFGSEP